MVKLKHNNFLNEISNDSMFEISLFIVDRECINILIIIYLDIQFTFLGNARTDNFDPPGIVSSGYCPMCRSVRMSQMISLQVFTHFSWNCVGACPVIDIPSLNDHNQKIFAHYILECIPWNIHTGALCFSLWLRKGILCIHDIYSPCSLAIGGVLPWCVQLFVNLWNVSVTLFENEISVGILYCADF